MNKTIILKGRNTHFKGWLDSEREGVASMLSLGYRLKDPKHPRSRKPRQEVICWLGDK